jgi:LPS sulfotransferase NodH
MRPTPFVIFATQRTGSTWLMDSLDAHPAVAAYDELLLAGGIGNGYWGRKDLEFFEAYYKRNCTHVNTITRALWSVRYLNRVYSSQQAAEAIGMKLMYDQLWKNPWLCLYLIRHRVRVLHLVRANLLDVVLSLEMVKARNQPHAWKHHMVETSTVTLDPDAVMSTLHTLEFRVRFARRLLAALPLRCLEISYERLVSEPALLNDVLAFLGVQSAQSADVNGSKFKKLNTLKQSELIDNYAEVERALADTRFERFLDRGLSA